MPQQLYSASPSRSQLHLLAFGATRTPPQSYCRDLRRPPQDALRCAIRSALDPTTRNYTDVVRAQAKVKTSQGVVIIIRAVIIAENRLFHWWQRWHAVGRPEIGAEQLLSLLFVRRTVVKTLEVAPHRGQVFRMAALESETDPPCGIHSGDTR